MKLLAVIALAARSLGIDLSSAEAKCYATIAAPDKRRINGWLCPTSGHLAALLMFLPPFVSVVTGASAPALSYALTTTAGPVQPGQGIQFTATVTNLSSATQSVTLNYVVPQFTTASGDPAGTAFSYFMGNVAPGATQVVSLDLRS
jgi:hypothetical protein